MSGTAGAADGEKQGLFGDLFASGAAKPAGGVKKEKGADEDYAPFMMELGGLG